MCHLCRRSDVAVVLKAKFDGNQFVKIPTCDSCLTLMPTNLIAFCKGCGSYELWSKEYYCHSLGIENNGLITVILVEKCLNCSEEGYFFEI